MPLFEKSRYNSFLTGKPHLIEQGVISPKGGTLSMAKYEILYIIRPNIEEEAKFI